MGTQHTKPTVYVGFDGEGYWDTDVHDHIYDMMKIGDYEVGSAGHRITHINFLRAVRSVGDYWLDHDVTPVIIGYFINYDLTQVTRSMDDWTLNKLADRKNREIWTEPRDDYPIYKAESTQHSPVYADVGPEYSPDRYKIDWMMGKWMTVAWPIADSLPAARSASDPSKIKWRRVKIVDVGTAFGGGFLPTVEKWLADELTDWEREVITAGKAERGHEVTQSERAEDYERIDTYNRTEIELLERLMVRLWTEMDTLISDDGTLTKEIDGPGCIAAHWLDNVADIEKVREAEKQNKSIERKNKDCLPGQEIDTVPVPDTKLVTGWDLAEQVGPDAYRFVNDSYFGGWFETCRFGLVRDVYEYDLNSAYPDVIRNLPSLDGATAHWTEDETELWDALEMGDLAFAEVMLYGASEKIGPAMYRDAEGRVTRPRDAHVIINMEEMAQSIKTGLVDDYTITRGLVIELPRRDETPLDGMAALYQYRLDVGKKSLQGLAAKLLMNSAYGKLCQSIGIPRWAQPIYASLITSRTRIALMKLVETHPRGIESVISFATDAVFFDSPHETVECSGTELGKWDLEQFSLAYFVQSGVWGAAESNGEKIFSAEHVEMDEITWDVKSRGMSARAFRSRLESVILPELLRAERDQSWNENFEFHTRETFSMVSLPEAYSRGDVSQSGSFQVGEHGTPETMRSVSLRVSPKRMHPTWTGNGFDTKAPVMAPGFTDPSILSASRKDMIGGVSL